jgi:uncharacterized membrane protein
MATDEIGGPVELAVLEFPGSQFNGEIVPALAELVNDGIVRILDLVLVTKDDDGTVTSIELSELDDETAAPFDDLDGEVNGLLTEDDLAAAGEALSAGSSAMVIVWEDAWARRLVDAIRGSGGRLVAHDRLDADTVQAALAESAND